MRNKVKFGLPRAPSNFNTFVTSFGRGKSGRGMKAQTAFDAPCTFLVTILLAIKVIEKTENRGLDHKTR